MPNNLKQKITLIGATGLIGTHFLEEISPDDFFEDQALTSDCFIDNYNIVFFIISFVHFDSLFSA